MKRRFNQILEDVSNYVSEAAQKTYKGKNRRFSFWDKKSTASSIFKIGNSVKNINTECKHYGSEGVVTDILDLPNDMGKVVTYKTVNCGQTWSTGDSLTKTETQLALMEPEYDNVLETPSPGSEENETPEMELEEYKQDFLSMNIGSLTAIMNHAMAILKEVETNHMVKENLTESWLQGKIAITEDYMRTIHDFVKYVPGEDDDTEAQNKPGLWENIRRKRERMGKRYKPSKPGDKDRPDPEQWNNLTK